MQDDEGEGEDELESKVPTLTKARLVVMPSTFKHKGHSNSVMYAGVIGPVSD
jgi:hypothetical protein